MGKDYESSPKFPLPTGATKLAVSKQTVYRMVDDHEIESHNVRGQIRISESQLNDYLTENVTVVENPDGNNRR